MTQTLPAPAPPKQAPALGLVVAALGVVYVVWGSTYLAIKVSVRTLPPLLSAGLRFLAAGLVLAGWMVGALLAFAPPLPEGIRVAVDLGVDWRVFAYAAGFSTLTGILFGLAPALHRSRTEVSTVLKNDATAVTAVQRRARGRE